MHGAPDGNVGGTELGAAVIHVGGFGGRPQARDIMLTPGVVGGAPGNHPGANAHAGVLGQTQTMTINGQQVQVWVPMAQGGGVYGQPQQGQGPQGGRGGAVAPAGGGSPPRAGGEGAAGQNAPRMFHGHLPGGSGGMILVQQPNGQQVWVPAQQGHPGLSGAHGDGQGARGAGAWTEDGRSSTRRLAEDATHQTNPTRSPYDDDGALRQMERGATAQMLGTLADGANDHGVPLGLGLKRSDSLQQMVESSGLLDGEAPGGAAKATRGFDGSKLEGGAMDADVFRDAEMLEEDALDAILAHARDGNLLSFDGMDEAMLEAAAGPDQGVRRA